MRNIFLILLLAVGLEARPNGAPPSACQTMTPVHSGIQVQASSPPYRVSAVKSDNTVVRVTISSPYGEEFEGFMLQARSKDGSRVLDGTFSASDSAKTVDCGGGRGNTLTQVKPSPKIDIQTEWTPSGSVNEEVIFRATVAKTFALFWTRVDSEAVRIAQVGGGHARNERPGSGKMSESSLSMYEDCYSTKGCFAYPANCLNRNDCEVLLSFSKVADGIRFSMLGYLEEQNYMAMAFSTDGIMGDDSVTECFREGSSVIARHSYNEGKSNTRTRELSRDRYSGSFRNGLTTCTWTLPFITQTNERSYDLANNSYFALLAKGPMSNGRLQYHSGRIASSQAINFTALEAVEDGGASVSVKIHGAFMCTAWIGFVSLGILLAKAFKSIWEKSSLCGQRIWFALHRAFMLIALSLVAVALAVIFLHKNGWNYEARNPHAVLGCVATGLGLLQPIMATFRPSPDHKNRPIFNWLHFGVGNSAQLLAVITIFFAVSLESSGLKASFYWVVSTFVVLHLIFHLMFQLHMFSSKKKGGTNDLTMNDMHGGRPAENFQANVTENVFRILLLGLYCIFLLVILITLYALIGTA